MAGIGKRWGRASTALAVVAASLAMTPGPASATTAAALTVTGAMTTTPMGDLCTPIGTLSCVSDVVSLSGPAAGFALSSVTCLTGAAHVDEKGPMVPPWCSITAAGVFTGFCGRASGTGNGALHLSDLFGRTREFWFSFQLHWVSAQVGSNHMALTGTITRAYGGALVGTIVGRFSIVPDPTAGGSCTNGTATHWIMWGDWAFEIVDI